MREAAAAHERFDLSEEIRREAGFSHTYPGRQDDARAVLAFLDSYGELPPPASFWGLLLWRLRRLLATGPGRAVLDGRLCRYQAA